jgi:hypothetical protein
MDRLSTETSEHSGKVDFDIHGVVGIRLIDPSPSDLGAVCKLLGCPSRLPLTTPDITVRFVQDLPVRGIRFLGTDQDAFTDDGFFLLQEGTRRVNARIPFDLIGGRCEIVCKSRLGSVPLLIPIVSLTALRKECVPVHASAVVYNGVGILMAGWAQCGKTAALLGFASMGAEYVGEEWVLLSGNGQRMQGLVRPLELSHRHVATLPHVRNAVNLMNRCAFHGIGVLDRLQKMISSERTRSSLVFRSLQRTSAAVEERLRPTVAPSAIFLDRIRSAGAQVNKIFLFVNHEDHRIEVEPIALLEMARRLTLLVQHELTPLLRHYAAYRFAFPGQRNELIESVAGYSFGMLSRALKGKETYIVRLPYPHAFPELYKTIQPLCKTTTAAAAERGGVESRKPKEARTEQLSAFAATSTEGGLIEWK